MTRVLALLVAAILGTNTAGASDLDTPRGVMDRFLSWESRVQPSGVLSATEAVEVKTLLSKELLCLLNSASAANDIATHTAPDEKPPFVEGNLFLPSAWDRPQSHEIADIQQSRAEASVQVRFKFESGTVFTSEYFLRRFGNGWRIVEIARGGTCDFCQSGKLRASLYSTLKDFPAAAANKCRRATWP